MSNTSDLARQLRTDAQYKHALEIMADDIDQWLRDEGLLGHDPFTHNIILGTGDYPTGREIIAHSVEKMNEAADRIEELEAENARLVRDAKKFAAKLAIKGGNENYPTLWAYEQACAALDKHRARAEAAEEKLATARNDALEEAARITDRWEDHAQFGELFDDVIDRLSREIRALKVTP